MPIALGWIILLTLIVAVYAPGLSGPFVFDDSSNIVDNGLLHIKDFSIGSLKQAALSGSASILKRPVSMLTLAVNYALAGDDPFYYKLTNLVIHLLNAGLAGLLVLNLLRASPALRVPAEQQASFALIVAAIWALHPLHVTAVLYVVQRMTSLSALFTLLGLVLYVSGRTRLDRGDRGIPLIASAVLLCLPLAVLSKDNGILMVAYVAIVEIFVFAQVTDLAARRRAHWIASAVFVACVAATVAFFLLRGSVITGDYEARGLTMSQRLLTEGRVLIWYLQMVLLPDLSQLGLVHDDWALSTSLFNPLSTAFAWTVIAGLALAGWYLRNRIPAVGFGIGWFLAGHALESTIIPLDLVYEHRNYLPSLGLILGAASMARSASEYAKLRTRAMVAALVAIFVVLAALTSSRTFEWRSILNWTVAQVQRHPRSPANHYFAGMLYVSMAIEQSTEPKRDEFVDKADEMFSKALELSPAMASAQIARVVFRAQMGKPIPDDIFESLLTILHTQRLPSATQYTLIDMIDCAANRGCQLSEAQLQKIVHATLDNPYCTVMLRAMLFESLAGYYGWVKEDDATAIRYAREAAATPGAPFSSNFVLLKWLTTAGQYDEALSLLAKIDKLDTTGQYRQPRLDWREAIGERMRESKAQ
jgi:hypothetical protein